MNVQLLTPYASNLPVTTLPVFLSEGYDLKPFDERTFSFFDACSKAILANREVNRLSEIAALAFWLRRSNLQKIRNENEHLFDKNHFVLSPLGKVFHICPANVDTMFIYSLAVSVLMGNKNLLRISTRMEAPQILFLFDLMNELLLKQEYSIFKDYINIISYPHSDEISIHISQRCNARLIWGGDNTINTFRDFKPAPRTKDIIFADRISVLCIQCDAFNTLDENGKQNFAKQFFNDAYTFDQKGCSSPQSLFLIGNEEAYQRCVADMPRLLSGFVAEHYDTDIASIASLKLNQLVDDTINHVIDKKWGDNYATFATMDLNEAASLNHSCGGGYFYTRHLKTITGLKPYIDNKLQTVSYFGLNEKEIMILKELSIGEGIDRIVPLGAALDFYYMWDGYNLLEELSKKVYFKQ
jgi:hypothetical protein